MTQWEYKIVEIQGSWDSEVKESEETLNSLGQQGWDAVAMFGDETFTEWRVLMKRPT